ncbi:Outer membrane protein beta-barrel domain-containing protein [Chitinophaga sp. YR573]|uniref:outer membrane beta-barrel protein n=1 Tax=Chitinophaga sp. YR573 TaxID=1881040 RepID=UPI0008C076FD|nr:outer membrane beta-barrel protein [Chitinophaga sp. YR573]SEW46707.1 Outer membrane protein beta-barrel domain-containing protein [Chitinophaga sp. YR573]
MKRITLLCTLFFAVAISTTVTAQKKDKKASKFYLKVAGGYFFSVFPGQFPKVGPYEPHDEQKQYSSTDGTTTVISEKVLTGSYGAGGRGGLSLGWNLNRYMAVEATFNYYHSKKNLMTREVTTLAGSSTVLGKIESHGYVNAIDFTPSFIISPGYEKVNPYLRLGFVIPLWGRLNIETDASQSGSTVLGGQTFLTQTTIHREEQVKPNITLGFQGAFGVAFPISHKLDVFVEAEYKNVPVKSKEKEVKAYDENTKVINPTTGAVVATQHRGLGDLSTAESHTKYVTTLDQSSNTPVSQTGAKVTYKHDDQPSNDLKSYINIGGLGANAGLRWHF